MWERYDLIQDNVNAQMLVSKTNALISNAACFVMHDYCVGVVR